ncbi:MAG: hypothetical protein ACJ72E_05105 [Marmoricola sp.]
MRTRGGIRTAALMAAALVTTACVTGCGSSGRADTAPKAEKTEAADPANGPWLLRFATEAGADGELVGAVYVTLVPSTGATTVRRLPALTDPDTFTDSSAVLVSGDHAVALIDSRVPRADARRGVLRTYSTTKPTSRVVDVRKLTGAAHLVPVGAAFDPGAGQVLRVVDDQRRVWKLDLVAGTGTREGDLPRHKGWIFANGFDKNTGLPYIEASDSEDTLPAGNGADDVRAVQRQGGTIIDEGVENPDEPALPCGFATAFQAADKVTWLFCADTARIVTYKLADGGGAWTRVGTASAPVVPGSAGELPVVLPPVS